MVAGEVGGRNGWNGVRMEKVSQEFKRREEVVVVVERGGMRRNTRRVGMKD